MSTTTKAPDWDPRGYPSKGKTIGPAWQRQWDAMADGRWHDSRELTQLGSESGGCSESTARTLLHSASRHALLVADARQDEATNRWRMWYRRPDLEEVA